MVNLTCVQKQYRQFPSGDLISAPIDANNIAEFYSRTCFLLLFSHLLPLQAALLIWASSGASVEVLVNSLQLERSGNMLKHT